MRPRRALQGKRESARPLSIHLTFLEDYTSGEETPASKKESARPLDHGRAVPYFTVTLKLTEWLVVPSVIVTGTV